MIVVALASFGALVFAQLHNITKQRPPLLKARDTERAPSAAASPARKAFEAAEGGINWQHDLDTALEMAKADRKLVVVDVYTDWCGWCKKMDEAIYSDRLVVNLSYREVFLKLDAEDGGQGQRFARAMGVKGYPTTIVLDQAGYIQSPERFIEFVELARVRRTAAR
jgi:thiol:disulfide interchange protein